jgi:hypothetical protein
MKYAHSVVSCAMSETTQPWDNIILIQWSNESQLSWLSHYFWISHWELNTWVHFQWAKWSVDRAYIAHKRTKNFEPIWCGENFIECSHVKFASHQIAASPSKFWSKIYHYTAQLILCISALSILHCLQTMWNGLIKPCNIICIKSPPLLLQGFP